jgi:hypothetical protein
MRCVETAPRRILSERQLLDLFREQPPRGIPVCFPPLGPGGRVDDGRPRRLAILRANAPRGPKSNGWNSNQRPKLKRSVCDAQQWVNALRLWLLVVVERSFVNGKSWTIAYDPRAGTLHNTANARRQEHLGWRKAARRS